MRQTNPPPKKKQKKLTNRIFLLSQLSHSFLILFATEPVWTYRCDGPVGRIATLLWNAVILQSNVVGGSGIDNVRWHY
jgi:hypothetical protein